MKNLKTSSIILSLMTTLCFAVFFTSCTKEDIKVDMEEKVNTVNQEEAIKMLLPEEVTNQGEEAIKEYLQNISSAQKAKHINDYTIAEYLTKKGKIETLDPNGDRLGLPKDLNISDYLTGEEIDELKSKLITAEDVNSRSIECILVFELVDVEPGGILVYELVLIVCVEQ